MKGIVLLIVFCGSLAAGMIWFGEGERRRRRIMTQLGKLVQGRATRGEHAPSAEEAGREPATGVKKLSRGLTALIAKLVEGRPAAATLAVRLRQAGWRIQVSEFLYISLVSALVGFALSLLIAPDLLMRAMLVIAGALAPYIRLLQRTAARRRLFEAQLIDALTMIANALRSGYSFLQALDVAARELPEPIAGEFEQVLRETRVNISVDEALTNMVGRTGSADLDMAVTAITIQRQVGGNLGEVLDNISNTIRERLRARGEIRALTAQGRLSAWIVGLLPVTLTTGIYLLNRSYMQVLFTHPAGRLALALAALMEFIGVFLIRRIIEIEV
ncbi:MAG: type II secretion system F family protein [Chloroflexota bacterium]